MDKQPEAAKHILTTPFKLGEWSVYPDADYISRLDQRIRLEPRVMSVFTILAGKAGEVVTREELETEAWQGMVVSYDAVANTIIKLRKALGDDSRHPRYIETIPKKGYRLIAEITQAENISGLSQASHSNSTQRQAYYLYAGLALVIVLFASWLLKSGLTTPDDTANNNSNNQFKRTLMVLPFTNLDGNTDNEYFVDGITDDIITDLSGLSGIEVISRTVTFNYKGQDIDLKKISHETGADFLLEGSIRRAGKRWRINAKLINTYNNTNLWAQRFENTHSNFFDAQDNLAKGIVNALAIELNVHDKKRLEHRQTTSFEAYDLFLQGQKFFKHRTKDSNHAAQEAYRNAIKLDENYARAYGALAVSLVVDYWRGWSETPTETLKRALEMAKLATQLDPESPHAYWAVGYAHMYLKDLDKAAESIEHAIKLAPNYSDGYGLLALINNQLGNGEKAEQLIKKGMQLNPHYSWDFPYLLGRAYYTMGKYSKAIIPLRQALERNEHSVNPRMYLAASYIALGKQDDAQWEIDQIRVMSPEISISHLEKNYPIANKILLIRFLNHLRQAGLPE